MEVFGFPMEQLYMYILLAAGALTVLCVFFGEVAEFGEGFPVFNPIVILAFVTMGSAIGFLLETATTFDEWSVLGIAVVAAVLLDLLLYFFILLPLSSAESSIAYSEDSLPGQVANVITPIPVDGYGEVVLETYAGMISKRAAGYDNEAIGQDEKVLIVEVNDGTLYVRAYVPVNFGKKTKMARGI
ncbi:MULTISPECIES: hypothetical protein [Planococcus]|uniref:Membrane protein NfeD2 N-terminal transmembrane domain-containing protein n=1 Tax=Planococcus faecalis TaxID=1598147 RepID=A0ABN4XEE4_9BACL|nr:MULTISPECIES: hypothetical protein [Planococcus]AQU78177.1 hypothetical protein AJGP001_02150 [Planococcus faecalis]MDJ0331186.1 hypothetical protein [Planococcus sp. S3-L1]OHX53778.1 hypothetical protein BB777_08585 [Planococcus faecalis]